MKKSYYFLIPAIFAMIIALPMVTRADDDAEDVNDDDSTSISSTTNMSPLKKIREDVKERKENIQNNKDVRRDIITAAKEDIAEKKEIRKETKEDVKDLKRDSRDDIKNASSSKERKEIRKEMKQDVFSIRFNSVIKQLNLALNNIKQIKERIVSRIEKAESAGRDMTAAKNALVVANTKISLAEKTIADLASFKPATSTVATSTATTTATSTVSLDRPRQLADNAIKAVKSAKDALVDVVKAIAHNMGIKLGQTATTTATSTNSTATSTATSTTSTATTTATTTDSTATTTATSTATTTNP